jgi:hypothetical protein
MIKYICISNFRQLIKDQIYDVIEVNESGFFNINIGNARVFTRCPKFIKEQHLLLLAKFRETRIDAILS